MGIIIQNQSVLFLLYNKMFKIHYVYNFFFFLKDFYKVSF